VRISDLIVRKKAEINTLTERHNQIAEQLNEIRGAEAVDETKVEELRSSKGAIVVQLDAMRAELTELERESASDDVIARMQSVSTPTEERAGQAEERVIVTSEANPVYKRGQSDTSYFRDVFEATRGSQDAVRRLADSQQRAGTSAAGAGGEFAPPLWLVEDFVALARAGRVTADLVNNAALPGGVSSVNLPKVTGATDPAVVTTQNSALAEGNFTTTSVSSGVTEIAGKQTIAIALLRQSGIPLDQVILGDLARAHAVALDKQVIQGTGENSQLQGLIEAGAAVTYTSASPVPASATPAASFYSKVLGAQAALNSGRQLPADALVMHPRRWSWVLNGYDGQGRPLVSPIAQSVNAPGSGGTPTAQGFAGEWAGLPVYLDPNIPTNLGANTNQDVAFVLRADDLWLWESAVETASFDATLAAQNSILFRVLGFAAFIPHRHASSVQVIGGTGMVAPTF